MKRFKRFLINTTDFRKDVVVFAMIVALLGFVYPWIAKGAAIVVPFVSEYYEWVANVRF